MDKRYEVYALADRHFYETPDRLSVGPGQEAAPGVRGGAAPGARGVGRRRGSVTGSR